MTIIISVDINTGIYISIISFFWVIFVIFNFFIVNLNKFFSFLNVKFLNIMFYLLTEFMSEKFVIAF